MVRPLIARAPASVSEFIVATHLLRDFTAGMDPNTGAVPL
jgi:hypothetical protein